MIERMIVAYLFESYTKIPNKYSEKEQRLYSLYLLIY